jgi:hypothetical protein
MYFHVGPYTPYFGSIYRGIGSAPTMWPPMFNPLTNPIAPPKPILKIAQARIVINHGKPSDEDDDYSERKHNSRMPQIISIKKLYHGRRGKPSMIINLGRLPTSGQIVPTGKGGGKPFNGGGNGLLGSGGGGPLRGGNNGPP